MRVAALADVFKVVLYVIASFLLAAFITPYLFEIGKSFASIALRKDTTDEVIWLATKAQIADFSTYFKRAFFLSALVCFVPLFYSLDLRRHARHRRGTPWTVALPANSTPPMMGQPLKKVRWGILQTLIGFFLISGFFLSMAWVLFTLNWFEWDRQPSNAPIWKSLGQATQAAIFFSILEELFFRGALLGIFLRAFRPSFAIIGLSLIFAAIHFLAPPDHALISDPRSASAGFEMLSLIGQKFLQTETIIHSFIFVFLIGMILGVARYGTSSLWLPIGLHAGWIFSNQMFDRLAKRRDDFPEKFNLYMGENLTDGFIPIGVLMMIGITLALSLRILKSSSNREFEE